MARLRNPTCLHGILVARSNLWPSGRLFVTVVRDLLAKFSSVGKEFECFYLEFAAKFPRIAVALPGAGKIEAPPMDLTCA